MTTVPESVSSKTVSPVDQQIESDDPVLDHAAPQTKNIEDCTIVSLPAQNSFRSIGHVAVNDNGQVIARAMVPLQLIMTKSLSDLNAGKTSPIYARAGNCLAEVGRAKLSRSGNGINCFIFGSLLTMSKKEYQNMIEGNKEIRSVSVSTPEEPWFPPQYLQPWGGSKKQLGTTNEAGDPFHPHKYPKVEE